MKTNIHKHLLATALAAMLLISGVSIATVQAQESPLIAQAFTDATGLSNINNPEESGIQTDRLGIYGPDASGDTNLIAIISNIINSVFLLLGFVAVVLLIVEGILLIISRGNEERRKKVAATIINIAIGFGVILLSYAIVSQILAVLGANNVNTPAGTSTTITGTADSTQLLNNAQLQEILGYDNISASQLATIALSANELLRFNFTFPQSGDVSRRISADYRSTDYEFVAGNARLSALRGNVLRVTKPEWDTIRSSSFGLFVPGNDTFTDLKAWVKPQYTYAIPADARTVTTIAANSPSGTAGRLVDLKSVLDRVQEGIDSPNVIHVNIPGQTTLSMYVVVLKPGEENRYVYTPSDAFADFTNLNPTTAGIWTDMQNSTNLNYDRRRSYFQVKNKASTLEARTYTTGATIQLNDGAGEGDIEAEITLDDQNTLPATFQTVEHTLTRGDGTLLRDAAKKGDKISVTIPIGQSIYVVDDMTAILKDGKRVNLGSNALTLGNNANPRFASLSSMAQLTAEGSYTDISGTKNVRLMPGDNIALTKSGQDPVTMKFSLKYYSKEAPNLIDIVSPGMKNGFVRFVDGQVTKSGDAINNVVPYTVAPDLVFEQPGNYPVTVAIRDYTLGRTLATMQFNVSVVTDGTALELAPNYSVTVGSTYRVRTFPSFTSTSDLESKRVEIIRKTETGSGGQTVLNRTLTNNIDDFDYIFDQDGEYTFRLYNKFKGSAQETQVQKSIVVMPQSPVVDFDLQEKAGNPTVFELTDLSKYLESGTVFVDVNPYSAEITQSEWQTLGTKRVKELTFAKAGTYRVTVTGRNKYGETATKSRDVTVSTNITYDVQVQDSQGNVFPVNQTPRFAQNQSFRTRVLGKNIAKIEVTYGEGTPLLTMSNPTQESDGQMAFTGNIQLAEQGQYTLTYTFYSVTAPTEKALTLTRSILIRRPLEPLADFSVSEAGAVLSPTAGLCTVGGASKEGYLVKKNREYLFDGSASVASSDLPVNRDSATTSFRWNMGAQQLASRTVSVRERFISQSADANNCVPVTFTILENVNGQAKTSQLVKYFKVENSLPTYDAFVVEWPSGPLVSPMSVRAKLRGLQDPDEPSQNIQVLWFYEIQGNQLFNEVSYDTERLIRIENFGAEGSQNTVRVGAQIYDMNTKETVKVYSDARSFKTGTNPALRTSILSPELPQNFSYLPWVKGGSALNVRLSGNMTDGSALTSPQVSWTMQRYGTFEGCTSTPEADVVPQQGNQLTVLASFPECGLYRLTGLVTANGQRSQQTLAVKVYESDSLLSAEERPIYIASSGLRGSAPTGSTGPREDITSPFFPSGTGTRLTASATYTQALSPTVAQQAVNNGTYTSSGSRISASYVSVYDMLTSYNLPQEVIYDRLAEENPEFAQQIQTARQNSGTESVKSLLEKNLAGSAINYDPNKPYAMPFGTTYDIYSEFGLRPAAALNKVSRDDPALGKRVEDLRSKGANDLSIVQTLRNEQGLTVQANLHGAAEVPPADVVTLLLNEGLTNREIVDKLVLDNPSLEGNRAELLSAETGGALLQKLQDVQTENISFQALSPLRMSLARAYTVMKERAYTDKLILDKLRADDPAMATAIDVLRQRGVTENALLRQLLTEPGREVNIRVAGAIQSDFVTIFATLKRHGLSTDTIYEKMQQDDDVFRVVYEAQKKKTTDTSGYYQEFAQEPTLAKLTYKPESMFVLPLHLAYAEYSALGLTPTQVFDRLAKDNPNFGTDYETLKRQKAGGVEIFESLVRNGAARKMRFSYMRPLELPADDLATFFAAQGIPEPLALEKLAQDNPSLSDWYTRAAGQANFASLVEAFPRATLSIALFTGWDSTMGTTGATLMQQMSPSFALAVMSAADADLARLVQALRDQKKSEGEIYQQLVADNTARKLRLYPYLGVSMSLQSATRELSTLYPVDTVALAHIARFDDSFGDFYGLALRRLYTPASTLAHVGDRTIYMAAFRPVMATATDMLQAVELYGLPLEKGVALYAESHPELAELLEKHEGSVSSLVNALRALYPEVQRLPLNHLVTANAQETIRTTMGLMSPEMPLKDYLQWLMGWGISSDVGLAQLAGSNAAVAATLAQNAGASIDVKVQKVSEIAGQVRPQLHKRFPLSFVDAYRVYERRGLSTGLIYHFIGAQDPVFQSLYSQQRLARVSQQGMFDTFKNAATTQTIITSPLLPADVSTLYLTRALETQGVPTTVITKKLQVDQPILAQTELATLDKVLTAVARDSFLQTTPLSLTRAVPMDTTEKQALFKSYGVSEKTAGALAVSTGSGLTLPPQVVVDLSTYVEEAQEQGIGTQQLIEDVMRLAPDHAPALRELLAQTPDGSQLVTSLTTILTSNKTLPLFTRVQTGTGDNPVVAFGADINGSIQELAGYIPGTLPSISGSGALLSDAGDALGDRLLTGIQQIVVLPGGVQAYLFNTRLLNTEEAFRFQSLESLRGESIQPEPEHLARLSSLLTASGSSLRAAAPSAPESTAPANIFGVIGETTLLDCGQFAVTMTEEGEQTLVCATNTLYEQSLESFRVVLLRMLGATTPEEITSLMTAFERGNTLEDRLEGMTRLRDRVTRLPLAEPQRTELLRRLTFVRIFDLDEALSQQLAKRGADQLKTRIGRILDAAGTAMVTDRGTLAATFAAIPQQNEVGSVLLVRYSLAIADLLRSQSVDPVVKDMVIDSMRQSVGDFAGQLAAQSDQIGGAAAGALVQRAEALEMMAASPGYTFQLVANMIGVLRDLTDIPSLPEAGKIEIESRLAALAKQMGKVAADTMVQGIPEVAAARGQASVTTRSLLLESSIWERQRRGISQFTRLLAATTAYNATQKQEILQQLFDARKTYLTTVLDIIRTADFSEAARATLTQRLEGALKTTNITAMLEVEGSFWQYLETEASVAGSAKYLELWERAADFQVQMYRAATNVLSAQEQVDILPYFAAGDLLTDRQRDILGAVGGIHTSFTDAGKRRSFDAFVGYAAGTGTQLQPVMNTFVTQVDTLVHTVEPQQVQQLTIERIMALRAAVIGDATLPEQEKVRFLAGYDLWIRQIAEGTSRTAARTGIDLLATLRSTLDGRLATMVTSNPGLRPAAHVVHDLKKAVLAHPDLPLQYKLEMLFELQHAFPFSPFARAFSQCTSVYVKDASDTVRRLCLEEKNQQTDLTPIGKDDLFALMQATTEAQKPLISSASLKSTMDGILRSLTTDKTLSLEARRQQLSAVAQALEWPDVSYADRNAALAYIYSLPVISDEMLQLQETRLSLETYYLSLGELESRLRAIMLGVTELPDTLKGTVREALMQVKKYYSSDIQRSNIMLSLAGNVVRGSELPQARKDVLTRVLDTMGDTLQTVPVDRLAPEVSLEQMDMLLGKLVSVPEAQTLLADREEVERLLGQNDTLGSIGALNRLQQNIGKVNGLSAQEKGDLSFYTVVARDFLTYVQSQKPRVGSAAVLEETPQEQVVDPLPQEPQQVDEGQPSAFWMILWGIVYVIAALLLLVVCLGAVLYGLFLSYKRTHPDIHVDFEEYILVLRGQLGTFFKRFSRDEGTGTNASVHVIPDEPLPEKPAEVEEDAAPAAAPEEAAPVTPAPEVPAPAQESVAPPPPPAPPATPAMTTPSWLQLGDEVQQPPQNPVNGSPDPQNVQPPSDGVQSGDATSQNTPQ